eukprot:7574691-Pyramimonas_sp.AAC.1
MNARTSSSDIFARSMRLFDARCRPFIFFSSADFDAVCDALVRPDCLWPRERAAGFFHGFQDPLASIAIAGLA